MNDSLILLDLPGQLYIEWQHETTFDWFNVYRSDLAV